ncbi:DUF4235 domain-containing protein [Catellatospora sp. KI3]|uniref:DUF4235 domain-containing protein n=1 Tax=Catellatospora sp. KI3 TaxID=3041620 RepID=UPI0024824906|nr:DUF4235 domain-containing protein [Catellatospora sp. KI3]MDI1463413.1 DUF4235 domain-containing protein [Catellatospora sp. KI3]
MNKQTLVYKPIGMLGGALAGVVAAAAFKRVWRVAAGSSQAPHATDPTRGWPEILVAAAVQGAIFGIVKATVDRGGAHAVKSLTGRWPD